MLNVAYFTQLQLHCTTAGSEAVRLIIESGRVGVREKVPNVACFTQLQLYSKGAACEATDQMVKIRSDLRSELSMKIQSEHLFEYHLGSFFTYPYYT